MLRAREILEKKGHAVFAVAPESTVFDALRCMADKNVGAVAVLDRQSLVGIFSERDYARKVALHGRSSRETLVREIMTPNPVVVAVDTEIRECMHLMSDRNIRHLPVLDGTTLTGVISIGDVVRAIIEDQQDSISTLEHYIIGR
jgi:CBS domain-containing protein